MADPQYRDVGPVPGAQGYVNDNGHLMYGCHLACKDILTTCMQTKTKLIKKVDTGRRTVEIRQCGECGAYFYTEKV